MSNVYLPEIPDVPDDISYDLHEFLTALKETVEILTGKVGGNNDLIEYMEADGTCPKCGA